MFEEFLSYLELERRYSPHTIDAYTTDLEQLKEFLSRVYDSHKIESSNADMLRSWLVEMMDSGKSAKTVNRKMSSVKAYFKWGQKYGHWQSNPSNKLSLPKISKRLPSYLEENQLEDVLGADRFSDDYEGSRDKLILEIFYNTGMRRTELIHLKWIDIDSAKGTIKVLGKRNKERLIPVSDELLSQLIDFKKLQQAQSFESNLPFVFTTAKGLKMYPKLVYGLVNKYLGEVSALKTKSPHLLRHTFATHMLNRGADLTAIKELLGHTSLAATQVYTHNSIEKLKEVHRKAHPKA